MNEKNNIKNIDCSLPRAERPEDAGVSSESIREFLEDLHDSGIENHSYVILRHGKVAAEGYAEPFSPDVAHPMYSVSKSITATAVGFALDENLFQLNTPLVEIFPEYAPKENDENNPLWDLNIYHLLTMTSGKEADFLDPKFKGNWIKRFFEIPWSTRPGEEWRYVSENTFMLSAVMRRVTGLSLTEYLTPRLYEPLGIEPPFWETDENGVEAGGWGIYLCSEDLAKIMLCYSQNGVYNGKQVLPQGWVEEATGFRADNSCNKHADTSVGYGYCFWRCAGVNGYRADGLFSQFGIVFEDYDAVLILTNAQFDEQFTLDCIWRHFPSSFIEECNETEEKVPIEELEKPFPLDVVPVGERSPLEEKLQEHVIKVKRRRSLNLLHFPPSIIPMQATYLKRDKAGNFDLFSFSFGLSECTITWREGDEENTVICGMDGSQRYGKITLGGIDYTVCASAAWKDEKTLIVWIRPLETIAKRILTFTFHGHEVSIKLDSAPSIRSIAGSMAHSVAALQRFVLLRWIIRGVMQFVYPWLEPRMHGFLLKK